LLLLLLLAAVAPLRIGRVTIEALPVFSEQEAAHGVFYHRMNVVHAQTRAELLRRFLLFTEGGAYDPAKLAETERNLRRLDFLVSASVTASAPHDGVVDVKVVTQDGWTTVVNGDFSNDGGKKTYDVDLTQKDIWGGGADLQLRIDHGVERNTTSLELTTPAAFGKAYWNLDGLYSKSSDGDEEKLALERPLYSYSTTWSGSFLYDHLLRNDRIFALGEVAARFRQQHRELALSRSRVLHASVSGSSSVVGGVDLLDDSFSHLPRRPADVIPNARHFRFLDAGYESTGFDFVKLDYIDRDLREQDFNLARIVSLHAAVSPRWNSQRPLTWRFGAAYAEGHAFNDHSFVLGQISATTRAPRDRNSILSVDVRSVTRIKTRYPQAFVARARLDLGWQLDRDVQFLADGQNGLRAYPNFAFEGNRRFLVNAEHRLFLGRELLQLFAPSVAVFVDSGQAVTGPIRLSQMKSDVGVGLRIGIARFDSALIRIDYAYALNPSPISRRGHVWSISTMQAF
jgi:hypothetical protein